MDGGREGRAQAFDSVQPALPEVEFGGVRGERVDQGPVGQVQEAAGGLHRQAGVQGVLLGVPLHLVDQALAQPRPVGGVGQPVPGDGRGRCGNAHREQLRAPDQPAPPELRRPVRGAGHGGELRGPGAPRAAPGEPGRPDVEHGRGAGHPSASRLAQHGAVADPQRQFPAQGQPGRVLAQWTDGHRDGGGTAVQSDGPGQVGGGFPGDPDVDEPGAQPALRRQQDGSPPEGAGAGPVHVDGHARHTADGVPVLVQ
ncbi:hypothetical protein [Streptomyces sp. NPDC050534]|uniref:hypothetical protein n=1 Tax=Streptomyces sp. NPDC050534 TaxID=3365625 RepID=UPI0037998ED0